MFKLASLFVEITGNAGPLNATLASVNRSLVGIGSQVAALTGLGKILGVGAAFGAVVKETADLEMLFIKLAKATNLNDAEFKVLEKQLLDLSTSIKGISVENLIEIATTGAKLGIAAGNLAEYTEGIAKVSTAMDDIPASVVADEIGKINTVFKLGIKGFLQLGSAIDKIADSGVSSASGILNVTQRLSGASVAAKLTAQETIALAGALLDTGSHAELASTAIQHLVGEINNVESHKGFAKAIGVSVEEFANLVKTKPMQAISGFLRALKGMDAASQGTTLKSIGISGVQGGSEIQKLAQQIENLENYVRMANKEFDTLNQINQSYLQTAKALYANLEPAINAFKVLGKHIGETVNPAINALIGLAQPLVNQFTYGFDSWSVAISRVADRLMALPDSITAAFGPGPVALVRSLAEGIAYVAGIVADTLGIAIRNFPDLVDIAVLRATQAFINLGEYVSAISGNFGVLAEYVANNWARLLIDALNAVGTVILNLGANLAELAAAFLRFLKDPTQGFTPNWVPLLKGFKAEADELPDVLKPALTSLQAEIDAKMDDIRRREEEFKGRNAAAAALPKPPEEKKPATAGEGATTKEAKNAEKTDLAGFYDHLAKLVGGDKTVALAERTARATELSAEQLQILALRLQMGLAMPGYAVGPA